MSRHLSAATALAAMLALYAGEAATQSVAAWPSKPIKIVVTLMAGGSNDIIARLFAQKLSDQLKQPVVVENKAGGSGIPGTDYVAKAIPDGYTLLLGNTTGLGIQPSLFSKLPYDTQRDFAPISVLTLTSSVLVVNSSVAARSVGELVALAKANPRKLNYASPGNGSPYHLSAELFKSRTGTDIVHIPYKGVAAELVDLLAGRVQLMFANVPEVLQYINTGELRPMATTGASRLRLLPDVPTMAESGISNAESLAWFAMVAPRATPKQVISTLNAEIVKAQNQPDVRQRLHELGFDPVGNSPEESEVFIRNEVAKWARVVKDSGAKVDN